MNRHRHHLLDPADADPALHRWRERFDERGRIRDEEPADREPTRHRQPEGDLSGPDDHG